MKVDLIIQFPESQISTKDTDHQILKELGYRKISIECEGSKNHTLKLASFALKQMDPKISNGLRDGDELKLQKKDNRWKVYRGAEESILFEFEDTGKKIASAEKVHRTKIADKENVSKFQSWINAIFSTIWSLFSGAAKKGTSPQDVRLENYKLVQRSIKGIQFNEHFDANNQQIEKLMQNKAGYTDFSEQLAAQKTTQFLTGFHLQGHLIPLLVEIKPDKENFSSITIYSSESHIGKSSITLSVSNDRLKESIESLLTPLFEEGVEADSPFVSSSKDVQSNWHFILQHLKELGCTVLEDSNIKESKQLFGQEQDPDKLFDILSQGVYSILKSTNSYLKKSSSTQEKLHQIDFALNTVQNFYRKMADLHKGEHLQIYLIPQGITTLVEELENQKETLTSESLKELGTLTMQPAKVILDTIPKFTSSESKPQAIKESKIIKESSENFKLALKRLSELTDIKKELSNIHEVILKLEDFAERAYCLIKLHEILNKSLEDLPNDSQISAQDIAWIETLQKYHFDITLRISREHIPPHTKLLFARSVILLAIAEKKKIQEDETIPSLITLEKNAADRPEQYKSIKLYTIRQPVNAFPMDSSLMGDFFGPGQSFTLEQAHIKKIDAELLNWKKTHLDSNGWVDKVLFYGIYQQLKWPEEGIIKEDFCWYRGSLKAQIMFYHYVNPPSSLHPYVDLSSINPHDSEQNKKKGAEKRIQDAKVSEIPNTTSFLKQSHLIELPETLDMKNTYFSLPIVSEDPNNPEYKSHQSFFSTSVDRLGILIPLQCQSEKIAQLSIGAYPVDALDRRSLNLTSKHVVCGYRRFNSPHSYASAPQVKFSTVDPASLEKELQDHRQFSMIKYNQEIELHQILLSNTLFEGRGSILLEKIHPISALNAFEFMRRNPETCEHVEIQEALLHKLFGTGVLREALQHAEYQEELLLILANLLEQYPITTKEGLFFNFLSDLIQSDNESKIQDAASSFQFLLTRWKAEAIPKNDEELAEYVFHWMKNKRESSWPDAINKAFDSWMQELLPKDPEKLKKIAELSVQRWTNQKEVKVMSLGPCIYRIDGHEIDLLKGTTDIPFASKGVNKGVLFQPLPPDIADHPLIVSLFKDVGNIEKKSSETTVEYLFSRQGIEYRISHPIGKNQNLSIHAAWTPPGTTTQQEYRYYKPSSKKDHTQIDQLISDYGAWIPSKDAQNNLIYISLKKIPDTDPEVLYTIQKGNLSSLKDPNRVLLAPDSQVALPWPLCSNNKIYLFGSTTGNQPTAVSRIVISNDGVELVKRGDEWICISQGQELGAVIPADRTTTSLLGKNLNHFAICLKTDSGSHKWLLFPRNMEKAERFKNIKFLDQRLSDPLTIEIEPSGFVKASKEAALYLSFVHLQMARSAPKKTERLHHLKISAYFRKAAENLTPQPQNRSPLLGQLSTLAKELESDTTSQDLKKSLQLFHDALESFSTERNIHLEALPAEQPVLLEETIEALKKIEPNDTGYEKIIMKHTLTYDELLNVYKKMIVNGNRIKGLLDFYDDDRKVVGRKKTAISLEEYDSITRLLSKPVLLPADWPSEKLEKYSKIESQLRILALKCIENPYSFHQIPKRIDNDEFEDQQVLSLPDFINDNQTSFIHGAREYFKKNTPTPAAIQKTQTIESLKDSCEKLKNTHKELASSSHLGPITLSSLSITPDTDSDKDSLIKSQVLKDQIEPSDDYLSQELDKGKNQFKEKIQNQILKVEQFGTLKNETSERLREAKLAVKNLEKALLRTLQGQSDYKDLVTLYGDKSPLILSHYLKIWREGKIGTHSQSKNSLDVMIGQYVLESTRLKLIEKLEELIGSPETAEISNSMSSKSPTYADRAAWEALSQSVIELTTAINKPRGDLKNELKPYERRLLYVQFRLGIVYRKDQLEMIVDYIKSSNRVFQEMRMGLGKTSVILPTIMDILSESDLRLPVGVVSTELFDTNLDEMDETTRLVFEMAGYPFKFSINDLNAATTEKTLVTAYRIYHRLLTAKDRNSYLLTIAGTRAALQNAIVKYSDELQLEMDRQYHLANPQDENGKISEPLKPVSISSEAQQLMDLVDVLSKIDAQFDQSNAKVIVDEGDEVMGSHRQMNVEIDRGAQLDKNARDTVHELFSQLLKDPIGHLILSNDHDTLEDKTVLKTFIKNFAKEKFKNTYQEIKNAQEPTDPSLKILHLLYHDGLSSIFSRKAPNRLKCDPANGLVAVPAEGGISQKNTHFGKAEIELAATYLLTLSSPHLPAPAILKKFWADMRKEVPSLSQEFSLTSLEELSQTNMIKIRLLLAKMAGEEFIFSEGSRIENELQSAWSDSELSFMSGSSCHHLDLLLKHSNPAEIERNREVTAEVRARFAVSLGEKGLQTEINQIAKDEIPQNVDVILNQGGFLESQTTLEIVKKMSKSTSRAVYYIDPTTRQKKICINEDNKLSHYLMKSYNGKVINPMWYYDPASTRGINFIIPSGKKAALFLSPSASESEFEQTIYRMRKLGAGHQLDWFATPQVYAMLQAGDFSKVPNTSDFLNLIDATTRRKEQMLNQLAVNQHLKSIQRHQVLNAFKKNLHSHLSKKTLSIEEFNGFKEHWKPVEAQFIQRFDQKKEEPPSEIPDYIREFSNKFTGKESLASSTLVETESQQQQQLQTQSEAQSTQEQSTTTEAQSFITNLKKGELKHHDLVSKFDLDRQYEVKELGKLIENEGNIKDRTRIVRIDTTVKRITQPTLVVCEMPNKPPIYFLMPAYDAHQFVAIKRNKVTDPWNQEVKEMRFCAYNRINGKWLKEFNTPENTALRQEPPKDELETLGKALNDSREQWDSISIPTNTIHKK